VFALKSSSLSVLMLSSASASLDVPSASIPQPRNLSSVRTVFSLRADAVAGHNTTVIMKVTNDTIVIK